MSDSKEALSALVDGQATDFEVRRLMQEVAKDDSFAQTWRRYQVARSVLKGDTETLVLDDLSSRVALALEQEPAYADTVAHDLAEASNTNGDAAAGKTSSGNVWRSLSSMAVAASVTALVILGANQFGGTESSVGPAPVATVMPAPVSSDLVRAQFGERANVTAPSSTQTDIIRLSQGLKRYIDQHQQLVKVRQPQWQSAWVPEGYQPVSHELLPHGEVMMYSNGEGAFSVTVEELGYQRSEAGVAQADGLVAVGRRQGDHFVTVVGDVPLMMADRIASNVSAIR